MLFTVLPSYGSLPPTPGHAYLIKDNWDDWFRFETKYHLTVVDLKGERHDAGAVKIGQFGQTERVPSVPPEFDALDERFFSLGQSEDYYATLNELGHELRTRLLRALRDVAYDTALFERARGERVMRDSLLRSVTQERVRTRLHRLAHGNAQLTQFAFTYEFPSEAQQDAAPLTLDFTVEPDSMPPTNIHVLIGRNGVGKTRCLNGMTRALVEGERSSSGVGVFRLHDATSEGGTFANLVSVSFSAFDPFDPLEATAERPHRIPYEYIGLKWKPSQAGAPPERKPATAFLRQGKASARDAARPPKSPGDLTREFAESLERCRVGVKAQRLKRALEMLAADPLFEEAGVVDLSEDTETGWEGRAAQLFGNLSSGHKIVLLTITRLVETLEERSLVLLDEPEAHLHPPLLSAFVRSLSDLLTQRNGVAIIATHSPVVLQEAPRTCAWILRRSGPVARASRPEVETFGENVGVLTREVFKLEVTKTGFHRLLEEALARLGPDYDAVMHHFGGMLGAEARSVLQGLIAASTSDGSP